MACLESFEDNKVLNDTYDADQNSDFAAAAKKRGMFSANKRRHCVQILQRLAECCPEPGNFAHHWFAGLCGRFEEGQAAALCTQLFLEIGSRAQVRTSLYFEAPLLLLINPARELGALFFTGGSDIR